MFSVLDLYKAYYQIKVYPKHVHKTVVQTPAGLFEFLYMPFGLKTAAQTFQRFVNSILHDFREFCFVYIDHILIYSKNRAEHLKHLRLILARLNEYGLKLNVKKSKFSKPEVDYLGYKVDERGILPTDERVQTVRNLPKPKTFKQLKSFICLMSYYSRFIPNYLQVASLTRAN